MPKRMHHHHKRQHQLSKIIALISVVIIILIGGVGAYYYYQASSLVNTSYKAAHFAKERNASELVNSKKPISVLLLGTDTGALNRTYKGRTDSIMVMTLNPAKKLTTITSIPRDTRTTIIGFPKQSPAKINAAYAYGSAGTAMATVQELIGNPIDYYVLINMGGLEKVINKVNGVTVTSPLTFTYEGYHFKKGQTYHMNGAKALQFSRMRYQDPQGDYGRQARQRLVIMALIKELKRPANLTNMTLLKEFLKNVQTDIKFTQLKTLLLNYRDAAKQVKSDHLQGSSKMIDGQSFEIIANKERNRIASTIAKALQQ